MLQGFKRHPYIPNSEPSVEAAMLKELGLSSLEDLHAEVPEEIKLKENMNLPPAFASEMDLKKHLISLLRKNAHCEDNLNFLGAGCWQHYVPAVCDEINGRGEFLTAYGGESYNDFGRFQTLFEYESLVAELVDMEVVNVPTFDWSQAAATALRMAGRINGRKRLLVPATLDPQKLMVFKNYCQPRHQVEQVAYLASSGLMDIAALRSKLGQDVAAVYFENPSYLGFVETQAEEIAALAHEAGAEVVVGVDPISLGVLAPPVSYGADIVCGELQPLGMHMNYGGGQAGFIATSDDPKYVMEYPSRLFGICPTAVPGEYGFGDVAYDRTSFGHHRHEAKEYVGTQAALWGITAGVYLALMGPDGMREVGQAIMQNANFAAQLLNKIPGVNANRFGGAFFKEFIVDFCGTGKTVREINQALLGEGIFGGLDLSGSFPELGQSALYCVTEVHSREDLLRLSAAISRIAG
ncbi:MAG: aminomethyl-transferring glycine dehydrogenase subunit GcvPA [Clostridiales bacterium]|nr:aminomethyl-transferring glycine dehydrogenase subunit GcvPA [Clostridiales bacterium]